MLGSGVCRRPIQGSQRRPADRGDARLGDGTALPGGQIQSAREGGHACAVCRSQRRILWSRGRFSCALVVGAVVVSTSGLSPRQPGTGQRLFDPSSAAVPAHCTGAIMRGID